MVLRQVGAGAQQARDARRAPGCALAAFLQCLSRRCQEKNDDAGGGTANAQLRRLSKRLSAGVGVVAKLSLLVGP